MCNNFGQVVAMEIPRPNPIKANSKQSAYSYGVAKLFLKFDNIIEAKIARYKISGMQ